jgi:hypothetical protein
MTAFWVKTVTLARNASLHNFDAVLNDSVGFPVRSELGSICVSDEKVRRGKEEGIQWDRLGRWWP